MRNRKSLLVILWHCKNGSPEYPLLQTQMGIWFWTLQKALTPQRPKQGSTHFWDWHALSVGQSWLKAHSGLQFGGAPIISGKHEHLHSTSKLIGGFVFGPQGFGTQGSSVITGSTRNGMIKLFKY